MGSGRYQKIWTCKSCNIILTNPQANQPQGLYCECCREKERKLYLQSYSRVYYNTKKIVAGALILLAMGGKNEIRHRPRNTITVERNDFKR